MTRAQKVNQNFINKKFLCLKFEGPTMSACENNDTVFCESRPVTGDGMSKETEADAMLGLSSIYVAI